MSASRSDASVLLEAALEARRNAYAPYSGFAVGAAFLSETGEVFAGCNVENVSYPVGTCAEAGALAALVAAGAKRIFAALVVADGPALITPCGACRQRLAEFAPPHAPVYLARPGGTERTTTVGDLLPGAFGSDSLGARFAGEIRHGA